MEELIIKYESLIYKIARRFYNVELSDLYQAGCIGLIKAYNNYLPSSDTPFINFAYMYIFGEMYELVGNTMNIKLNKNYMRLYKRLNEAKSILFERYGYMPSTKMLSNFLEIDEKTISEVTLLTEKCLSLDSPINDGESSIMDCYGSCDNIDDKILIKDSMDSLSSDEYDVIYNRYYNDMSQSEVASLLGISQVKVSRIEKKGKTKMKEYISI